jgi:hypothetical protein
MVTEGWLASMTIAFGIEVGVVPTEDAKVIETYQAMARLHERVCCLVDGDGDGLQYAAGLIASPVPPFAVIRWHDDATIEDAIGWILQAEEATVVAALAEMTQPAPTSVAAVVSYLKSHKMDIVAYEQVADAIANCPPCRTRAADLLGGLASVCAGSPATLRFALGANGVWTFQQ